MHKLEGRTLKDLTVWAKLHQVTEYNIRVVRNESFNVQPISMTNMFNANITDFTIKVGNLDSHSQRQKMKGYCLAGSTKASSQLMLTTVHYTGHVCKQFGTESFKHCCGLCKIISRVFNTTNYVNHFDVFSHQRAGSLPSIYSVTYVLKCLKEHHRGH